MQAVQAFPDTFSYVMILRDICQLDSSHLFLRTLMSASKAETIQVFYSELGNPIGYVIYANIDKYTYLNVKEMGYTLKYPYEWNEGGICFIQDVLFLNGWKKESARQLRSFIKQRRLIVYKKKERIRALIRRKRLHVSFFARGQ